ncbi:unnamed protein product [Schistocephalus solidus]|uniref:Uncharacterized protein n=1 Tax=Schistocephalus solidus TaxID=70667 RepID=A0A183S923_SCHSO|nr:unnamed protein product [Schistocephalus solidus]
MVIRSSSFGDPDDFIVCWSCLQRPPLVRSVTGLLSPAKPLTSHAVRPSESPSSTPIGANSECIRMRLSRSGADFFRLLPSDSHFRICAIGTSSFVLSAVASAVVCSPPLSAPTRPPTFLLPVEVDCPASTELHSVVFSIIYTRLSSPPPPSCNGCPVYPLPFPPTSPPVDGRVSFDSCFTFAWTT